MVYEMTTEGLTEKQINDLRDALSSTEQQTSSKDSENNDENPIE
jgi:hypothetical protein